MKAVQCTVQNNSNTFSCFWFPESSHLIFVYSLGNAVWWIWIRSVPDIFCWIRILPIKDTGSELDLTELTNFVIFHTQNSHNKYLQFIIFSNLIRLLYKKEITKS